jgi:internalin A
MASYGSELGQSFYNYCSSSNLPQEQIHTINVMKEVLKVSNCFSLTRKISKIKRLELFDKKITDLTPLSYLTSLKILDLTLNEVMDISPLKKLIYIEELDLTGNSQVNNLSPLLNLRNLKKLSLHGMGHAENLDYEPLSHLKKLEWLDLSFANIFTKDIIHLNKLPLKILSLAPTFPYSVEKEMLSEIAKIKSLEALDLWGNNIVDLPPLSSLKKLKILILSSFHLANANSLSDLESIEFLKLDSSEITDLSFLNRMKSLKALSLYGMSKIKDLGPINSLRNLERLSLRSTNIREISFLRGLKRLKELNLIGNNISDLKGLEEFKDLETLYLPKNVTDLYSLRNLKKLKSLWLPENKIKNLDLIRDFTRLEFLAASGVGLRNPDHFFENLNELKALYLDRNQITDISFISDLPNLEYLDISENNIQDLSPLKDLNRIKCFNGVKNPLIKLEDYCPISDAGSEELKRFCEDFFESKEKPWNDTYCFWDLFPLFSPPRPSLINSLGNEIQSSEYFGGRNIFGRKIQLDKFMFYRRIPGRGDFTPN